jgi:O-antigen/teichoic acid export membrane protein
MSTFKRIAGLSAAFLGSNLARGAIAFALSLVVGRVLGVERFGRWIWCTTWASTLTVVGDLGFGALLTRDGARANADPGRLLGTALSFRLVALIPAGAFLYGVAAWLTTDAESIAGLRLAVPLGIAGAAYGCFASIFRSQPRWISVVLAIETAWSAAQLFAAWIAVRMGGDVASLVALATIVQIAQIGSAMVLWRVAFGDRHPIHRPSLALAWSTFGRALPFTATGLVANLQTRIGPLLLGWLSTREEIGALAVAARFGSVARLVPGAVFAGALPVFAGEYERRQVGAEREYRLFDRAIIGFGLLVSLTCIVFAAPLVRLVYGGAFLRAVPALVWIAVAIVPNLMNGSRRTFLYAVGAERAVVWWSSVGLALQVAVALALMPSLGSTGAAVSVMVSEAAVCVWLRRIDPSTWRVPLGGRAVRRPQLWSTPW